MGADEGAEVKKYRCTEPTRPHAMAACEGILLSSGTAMGYTTARPARG